MAHHRFFIGGSFEGRLTEGAEWVVPLSEADLHHAARVARLRSGERVHVVDESRTTWECDVESVTPHELRVVVAGSRAPVPEPHVTLFAGVTKGHKMDLTVEKSVEIGVAAIVPVMSERSIVRWSAEKAAEKRERWQRVAASAAAQSRRQFVPEIESPIRLEDVVGRVSDYSVFMVAWEDGGDARVSDVVAPLGAGEPAAVLVGPEGGLTASEVATLDTVGARVVTLGRTVLRSETAGIVAAALSVYELGGLGGRRRG
jgi:16S rRNA (uracil1498-N3)-methyltransferase